MEKYSIWFLGQRKSDDQKGNIEKVQFQLFRTLDKKTTPK